MINLSVIFGWLPSRCFWCAALALAVVSGVCFFFGLGAGCIGVGNMAPTKFAVVSIIAFPAVVASTFGGVICEKSEVDAAVVSIVAFSAVVASTFGGVICERSEVEAAAPLVIALSTVELVASGGFLRKRLVLES